MQQLRELDGFDAIARLAYHLHVGLHGQQYRGAATHERLIVGDEDSYPRMIDSLTGYHEITLMLTARGPLIDIDLARAPQAPLPKAPSCDAGNTVWK
jgi:hypothetical protein